MPCLPTIQLQTYGSPLALEKKLTSMPSVMPWENQSPWHFPSFRLWYLSIFWEREEVSMGGLEFVPWGHIYMATHPHTPFRNISNYWSALLLFSMIRQTIRNLSETIVLSKEQDNGQHSTNSGCPAAAFKACSLPGWDLDNKWFGTAIPEGHGWTLDSNSQSWRPVWITLPLSSKACSELVKCGCKSINGCGTRCSCKKAKIAAVNVQNNAK